MQKDHLKKLIEIEIAARDFGFEWADADMILRQASSEIDEIKEAIENNESTHRIQEEVGDLLHTTISLCIFLGFDVDNTLSKVSDKFSGRMKTLEALAEENGLNSLKGQSMEYMLELWREAKKKNYEL